MFYIIIGLIWALGGFVWIFNSRLQFSMDQNSLGWLSVLASVTSFAAGAYYVVLGLGG